MTIGARDLLQKYGSRLAVAKAWMRGELGYDEQFAPELCGSLTIQAAEAAIRLEREEE
jgi:hypothetical protein